jgi:hypothetical protein
MIELWMPVTANVLLMVMGLLFTIAGQNHQSRFVGVICVIVAVLSLLANIGVFR